MNEKYDSNNNLIYKEWSSGPWCKYQYDSNNNKIYKELYDGSWCKYQYDKNNKICEEWDDGSWCKYKNGIVIDKGILNFNYPNVYLVL